MRAFAALYAALDASTSTAHKVEAMRHYFEQAPARDAAWAAYCLAGGKPRQAVRTAVLRRTACEVADIDDWLFEACYQAVGDLAETIAHVLPPGDGRDDAGLAEWVEQRLAPVRGQPPEAQGVALRQWWAVLDGEQRFLLVKLIGSGFRVGVSKLLVQRALAQAAGLDAKLVAQRMMGYTDAASAPTPESYAALLAPLSSTGGQQAAADGGQPYPFFLAHPLDLPASQFESLIGAPTDWLVEWKYDGIRAQAVKRAGRVWLWSRGEELISEAFPDAVAPLAALPDGTVLDGELLVWPEGAERPSPFAQLQKRLNRKVLGKKVLAEAPVRFVAYDLIEDGGIDLRTRSQAERRARLEARLGDSAIRLSPLVHAADWSAYAALRARSRERGVEGFMLKHRDSAYGSGRTKAQGPVVTWWKWKIEPMTADGVLVYAQAGHGRRASVYTDYTFAVWNRAPASAEEAQAVVEAIARGEPPPDGGLQLVPFAKAYSGLTDAEFKRVDKAIRSSTLEKFGPVRSVRPTLVFELGFEGIQASTRHKSGVAVRFPRMLRIRDDKPLHEADTLPGLRALIDLSAPRSSPATD
jgi:DNA ligase-1